jgi:hypothetical protein
MKHTITERKNIYKAVLKLKGAEAVKIKAIEEFSELATEVSKIINGYADDGNNQFIDELADAYIMSEQLIELKKAERLQTYYQKKYTNSDLLKDLAKVSFWLSRDQINTSMHVVLSQFCERYDAFKRVDYKLNRLKERLKNKEV